MKLNINCLLLYFFLFLTIIQIIKSDDNKSFLESSKSIQLSLVSNWGETPSYLEAAEFFYNQDKSLFWKFIEEFNSQTVGKDETSTTDKFYYDTTISTSKSILSKNTQFLVEFLSIDLSMRTFSPKVETFRQLSKSNKQQQQNSNNGGWVQINDETNKIITDPNEINESLFNKLKKDSTKEEEVTTIYEFDHLYPSILDKSSIANSNNNLINVILYADIKSEFFKLVHPKLKQLSNFGKINYYIRYLIQDSNQKLNLQGYGYELSIKNLEYKVMDDSAIKKDIIVDGVKSKTIINIPNEDVEGFNFHKLQKRRPELTSKLSTFRSYLMAKSQEAKELKVWELKDLGIQSAQKIIASMDPLRSLEYISQKFPTLSNSLSKTTLNETLKKQIESNQKIIPSSETLLLLNGRLIDTTELNPIELSQIILSEYESSSTIQSVAPISSETVEKLISSRLPIRIQGLLPTEEELELANPLVSFNNLETDYTYRTWDSQFMKSVEKSTTEPQDIFFKKNLLSTVIVLDMDNVNTFEMLPEIQQMIQTSLTPSRFSVVFYTGKPNADTNTYVSGKELTKVFLAFKNSNIGNRGAFFFVTALNYFKKMYSPTEAGITRSVLASSFQTVLQQMGGSTRSLQVALASTDYDNLLTSSNQFVERLSIESFPQVFLNGIPVQYSSVDQLSFDVLVSLYDEFDRLKPLFSQGILTAEQTGEQMYKTILSTDYWKQNNYPVISQFSPSISSEKYCHLITNSKNNHKEVEAQNVLGKLLYFSGSSDEDILTSLVVVGDFDQYNTRDISLELLKQIKSGQLKNSKVTFISNPIKGSNNLESLGKFLSIIKNYGKVLNIDSMIKLFETIQAKPTLIDTVKSVKEIIDLGEFKIAHNDVFVSQADNLFKQASKVSKEYLKLESSNKSPLVVLVNGRIITPPQSYDEASSYLEHQFKLVHSLEILKAKNTLNLLKSDSQLLSSTTTNSKTPINYSDLINKIQSLLGYHYYSVATVTTTGSDKPTGATTATSSISRKRIPSSITTSFKHKPTSTTNVASKPLKFLMIINPFNKLAQRLVPMVQEFSNKLNIPVDVILNPPVSVSELPLKTYYTYVIKLDSEFNSENGALTNQPIGVATNIPEDRVVTLALDIPSSWLVQPIIAKYDLDNIRLKDLGDEQVLTAVYELENIVIEGSATDLTTEGAPAGLELQLSPVSTQHNITQDTIVMHNFGYYQLKSNPGIWKLSLASGRSSEIMDIVEPTPTSFDVVSHHIVVIDSLYQPQSSLSVIRKPGKERTPILQPIAEYEKQKEKLKQEADAANNSFFSNLFTSSSNKQVAKKSTQETIHIFSVASGHLYERFLKIMMLSVVKNTESPIKFWFLKNYLSPGFKEFIPEMAAEYGFEYELVTYKWPWWLRKQTEKQRIIWSYKILFLDVLFPLDVPKIIFVDADQVVRTDMKELWDMDLQGASLGYTPFCDSNKDTEGFRFWKSGYWKQHLSGRPYHISALYVVDLIRFRRLAAGDQLRATYDQLSRDPNSLANLDQDLPNYLQQSVRIFSLPQEWLWCETWCDQESKTKAKTIDLCNNPLTKTPKLENAVRIIGEWTSLDNEAKNFEIKIDQLKQQQQNEKQQQQQQNTVASTIPTTNNENIENILSNLAESQKDLF